MVTDEANLTCVSIRLPEDILARLDALASNLSKPGIPISRAKAMKHVVLMYLALAEKEFPSAVPAATAATPKKKRKKAIDGSNA